MRPEADLAQYIEKARHGMRLTTCLESFGRLTTGQDGRPIRKVTLDAALLGQDIDCLDYAVARARYAGIFNEHFVASLPYVLEEQCRLGAALLAHAEWVSRRDDGACRIYTLGDGPGVTARALSDHARGKIRTLTCSPNVENLHTFEQNRPSSAFFFHGPFFDVNPESLAKAGLDDLATGFDLIIEDTTFQMYGRERSEPVQIAMRNLKPNGVFLLLEKLAHQDHAEFARRELQKDDDFKARFFDRRQIEAKRTTIVNSMDNMLVTLNELKTALAEFFDYATVIWNSGNFHTIAASNDFAALSNLISNMIPPAIPKAYQYMDLPAVILSKEPRELSFREPRSLGLSRSAL